jgi:hypothetical protein
MASLPVLYPPPVWTNQDIFLYHGTVDTYVPGQNYSSFIKM